MTLALTRESERYPVRIWAVDALTGVVQGDIKPVSGSTWSVEMAGGDCTMTVDVGLRTKDGGDWDWDAIAILRGWLLPGKRTVIATQGDAVLGEWLLTEREDVDATRITLTGIGWEKYPPLRQVRSNYTFTGVDQMTAAAQLLTDCFDQGATDFTIPTPADSGHALAKDDSLKAFETDYGSALSSICDTENGLEWIVVPTAAWSDGRPTVVTRTVVMGYPEIATASGLVARRPGVGARGGNVTKFSRPLKLERVTTQARVFGAGSGKKQIRATATGTYLTGEGVVAVTRSYSEPAIKTASKAARAANGKLADSWEAMEEPAPLTLLLEETGGWPEVGNLLTLDITPTPAAPAGASGLLRIGKLSWTLAAGAVDRVTVDGVVQ